MRVLIVEDEVRLAATLQDLLEMDGYAADVCHDGESGLDNALTNIYDVVLLDVMLPRMDGFTVVRQLRAAGCAVPVLMLTARSEVTDRVTGLDSFTLSCGERSVRLSRKEYDMMELLMLNQKVVITKEKLLVKIWGYESDAEDNNVEVYVSFLRKKLEHLRSQVKIKTIRMVGYCLELPEN